MIDWDAVAAGAPIMSNGGEKLHYVGETQRGHRIVHFYGSAQLLELKPNGESRFDNWYVVMAPDGETFDVALKDMRENGGVWRRSESSISVDWQTIDEMGWAPTCWSTTATDWVKVK